MYIYIYTYILIHIYTYAYIHSFSISGCSSQILVAPPAVAVLLEEIAVSSFENVCASPRAVSLPSSASRSLFHDINVSLNNT